MRLSIGQTRMLLIALCVGVAGTACAQTPPQQPPAAAAAATAPTLQQLDWLHGCWDGKVNQRDFREEWLPLRGDMMIGASQTVSQGKTQDFEYLRLESRPDGVYYVAVPSGKTEAAFRLTGKAVDGDDETFTFENPTADFPQRIVYRRGTQGWLYAQVEGTVKGQEHKVIYPMRRVDCQSSELINN